MSHALTSHLPVSPQDTDRVFQELLERGYSVARCITDEQAERAALCAVDHLDDICKDWPKYGIASANGCGIVKPYRLAGQRVFWDLRKAVTGFLSELVHSGKDCCSSIDAVAFSRCTEKIKASTLKPHVDISVGCPSHKLVKAMRKFGERFPFSIQCQLALVTREGGPSFVTGRLLDEHEIPSNNGKGFTPMKDEPTQNLVPLQPGQLLLWRSDLVHANQSGLPASKLGPVQPEHDRFKNIARLGLFVTVCPKIYRTEAQKRLKIERATKGFCTTHSPHVVSFIPDGANVRYDRHSPPL